MNYGCLNKIKTIAVVFCLSVFSLNFSGCSKNTVSVQEIREPENMLRQLCTEGKYHSAMKELVKSQAEWQAYTEKTGKTHEGAAGFEYMYTMMHIVSEGDAHWGKILDDPAIPYVYKTEMIFEILEERLGKGAVYMDSERNFIVPRFGLADIGAVIEERKSE